MHDLVRCCLLRVPVLAVVVVVMVFEGGGKVPVRKLLNFQYTSGKHILI